jgi:flagellin
MAVRIFNNLASLNAQRHLGINNQRLAQSIERVSSGLRINSASDDAAGLAISEKMRSDIRVLQQGLRNLNDGLSLVNVAEASLNEVSDMIIRMRELAAQAASGTIGDPERALLQVEVAQMIAEIDRVSAAAEFNGQLLFAGALDPASLTPVIISFGLDATANSQLDLNVTLNLANAGVVNATFFGVNAIDISTAAGAQAALTTLDTPGTGIDLVVSTRASFAAVQNRMTRIISTQAITVENLIAAESQIRDADIAAEIALLTRNQILVESATAMVGQANLIPQSVLQLLS